MSCFPYEVNDRVYELRKRFPHVSFTARNPKTFEDSAPIENTEVYRMVEICGTKPDLQKFVDKSQPSWDDKNLKRR
jgi:hypothetical protein